MSTTSSPAATVESDKVLLDAADGIATVTLNRPDAGNALDQEMVQRLADIIHQICDDDRVRVIVIDARGKAFCVGGDINAFQMRRDDLPAFLDALLGPLNGAIARLVTCGKPVVSVMNGAVGGGGIGLGICGDFVIASASMKLRCGYSAIGLTPDAGSSWFLARRAGVIRARQLFLLNEPCTAQECLQMGIVDAVYPDAELAERARELAARLAAGSRAAMARARVLVDAVHEHSLQTHLALERRYMVASGGEADVQEGISAFLEKRAPRFE